MRGMDNGTGGGIKVSVVIPVYQVENYLERAVDSVLAQTLEEKEIILVDDGSEDASPEICDRYAEAYPELIRVIHQENQGLGMARNAGARAARGEYIAFVDSDDTVEPEMYAEMFEKAQEGSYDMVMCDVRIIYVEEDRTTVVSSYPNREIDLADYIANGSNITYSVNKLFHRSIWEENRYEKMLFEDIALIPSLVTRYPAIGYVPKPFYNYYRRANTISTTFVGEMVDIIQSFRNFLDRSDPAYREEVVYNTAKQLYWNMTQSRVLFQADFIQLLQEYEKDFRFNPYIAKDGKIRKILDFLDKEVLPERFICVHFHRSVPPAYQEEIRTDFPKAELLELDETDFPPEELPPLLRAALEAGKTDYVEEYCALKTLCEQGGVVLAPETRANLNLKRLRLERIFFGFENDEDLTTGCYGAVKGHYVIRALLASYEEDNIFNKAYLPLKDRLRDFLVLHFQLKVNGRKQLLKKEIPVYLPSVLAYDMQDGENCAKKAEQEIPEGYELVSRRVLKMWSDRILENWSLYKQAANGKAAAPVRKSASLPPAPSSREMEQRIQEVVNTYEGSTSWRITKPLRALGTLWKRLRKGRK